MTLLCHGELFELDQVFQGQTPDRDGFGPGFATGAGLSIILMRTSGTNLMDSIPGFLHGDSTAASMIHRPSLASEPSIQSKQKKTL
jgi:hypothetical protein